MKPNASKKTSSAVCNEKNGDEFVDQFSLPRIQLDMMESEFGFVSIKLEFVTIFTDVCSKMSVYDRFGFGLKKHFNVF